MKQKQKVKSLKERLDVLLVKKGLCETRSRARALILAGKVYVDGDMVDKVGFKANENADISLKEEIPYVSRGGLKLESALQEFDLNLKGKVILDAGASTGGFTHCGLQHGASKVYAVDVGYGQLAWELRNDPRVVNLERTNIRYLEAEKISDTPDMATVDVAFISLKHVFPVLKKLDIDVVVALIKPQFEAGRERVGRKGVVRDPAVHEEVLLDVSSTALKEGYHLTGLIFSPIKGPQGNIEYLGLFSKAEDAGEEVILPDLVRKVVEKAHKKLYTQ